jgi:hypothetical protein
MRCAKNDFARITLHMPAAAIGKVLGQLYQFRVPGLCDCQACIRRLNEAQLAVIQHTEAVSFQELRQGGHLVWC